jgi:rhodanese-related sulfurtransferase
LWLALAATVGLAPLAHAKDCEGTACEAARSAAEWMSAGELLRLRESAPALKLIDLRAAEAFEAFHVPGALNLTPLMLKAKRSLWHSDPVVLIGSGAAYGALLQLREELLELGYRDVRVLDGGTAYWQDTVEASSKARPRTLEPMAFDLVRDRSRWVILDFASQPPQILPTASRVALQADTAGEAALAATANLRTDSREIRNVLVVADADTEAAEIAAGLDLARHNLFVLRGGWAAWDRHQRIARTLAQQQGNDALEAQCW